MKKCDKCSGSGVIRESLCSKCKGNGFIGKEATASNLEAPVASLNETSGRISESKSDVEGFLSRRLTD